MLKFTNGRDSPLVIFRKGKYGQTFRDVTFQPISQFGGLLGILLNRLAQLGFGLVSIRCIEDGPDICCHFPLHTLARHILTGVLLEYVPDQYFPTVTGILKNSLDKQINTVQVVAVAYDIDGNIIGGGYTFVDFVPAQGQAALELSVIVSSEPARIEFFPSFTSMSELEE